MNFARRVFNIAGWYGILALAPQYFMEYTSTHPEHFYGFIGVALAWQVLFLIIARDPVRYRMAMIPSVLEKISFGVACVVLFIQGRLSSLILAAGSIDLLLAVLFTISYFKTKADR